MIEKICIVCGKTFNIYRYRTITAKVCSYKCAGELKKTKIKRLCRNCGKIFSMNPSQFKYYKGAGKYCSYKCSREGIIKENISKPIKDKYQRSHRKADKDWKNAVREKDKCICQRCGIYQKYIHTHHIATRRRRPDLKHVVSNGICLCSSCHMWVHGNPLEAERLGFLSTEKYELKH